MNGIQGPDSVKQERLTVLIRRYEKDILRICYLYLHDTEQARDTVQETFLKAYTHLDSLRDEKKEKSWLLRIAVNLCRDHLRSPWVTHINRFVRPEDLPIAAEQPDETHTALTAAVMKVTIFTSRNDSTKIGDVITLTSAIEGFEDCNEISYQWMCDKGEGFEAVEGANGDSYEFEASAESLSWNWQLMLKVYIR